jgi:hypothetical protein
MEKYVEIRCNCKGCAGIENADQECERVKCMEMGR